MQVRGRDVNVIQYGDNPLISAYVDQKPGDCRRKAEPAYQCWGNCSGKFVVARFLEKQPHSITALLPIELSVHPQIQELSEVKDLPGLEAVAQGVGYQLTDDRQGKTLYFQGQAVAVYNPCGMVARSELFSEEAGKTVSELIARVDELYAIAEVKPMEAVLEDPAIAANLDKPGVDIVMAAQFGEEGVKFVQKLRQTKGERN